MITGKGRSGPDIWPETLNHGTRTEEIILTTWYKEVMKQNRIYLQQYHLLMFSVKEARYVSYTSFN